MRFEPRQACTEVFHQIDLLHGRAGSSALNSILWYDYETFSSEPATGRIAQFAALRTNEQLELVDEPISLYCKPSRDCLPDPKACLITGITPQKADALGLVEPEFARTLQALMARPGTCIAGFNTIRFDDNYTRFLFWRNLLDPYAHEWANGNSRFDLLDVARYTYALRPEGIEWPLREDGAPSFRLEHLSAANALPHEDAHDALADVKATLALARLIRARQPRLFDFAYRLRTKQALNDFLLKEQGRPLLHTSGMFPAQHGHTTAIAILGVHPRIPNRLIVTDLRQNPALLLETPVELLLEWLYTPGEELPEGAVRPALKELHLNRAPLLAPLRVLDTAGAERLKLDLLACQRHFDLILAHQEHFAKLVSTLYAAEPRPRALDPEAALYMGFPNPQDQKRLRQVHALTPTQLAALEESLQDPRLRELLFRYRARNWPESLTTEERLRWQELVSSRLLHAEGGTGMWAEKFFSMIEALRHDPSTTGREWLILDEVEAWGQGLLREAGLDLPD